MLFRSRQMFVGQRTQTIDALRGHLAEYGVIGPKNKAGLKKFVVALDDENNRLPDLVRATARCISNTSTHCQRRLVTSTNR